MDIPWDSVIWFILSALLIPAFVSWYSSDLRVAQMQKKRDHYMELVKTFEIWSIDISKYAPTTIPDSITNEFTPPIPQPINEIDYYEQFLEHMKSGYSDLWDKWTKLSTDIMEHNLVYVKLLNDIATEIKKIADKNNVRAIFPYYEKDRPRFYVNIPKMARSVISETQFRLEGHSPWYRCEPKYGNKTEYPEGIIGHQWEQWGETIIIHDDVDEAERIICAYKSLVDTAVFEERIYSVFENTKKYERMRTDFNVLIYKEVEKIHLGNDMKGKCSICKQFSLVSRILE